MAIAYVQSDAGDFSPTPISFSLGSAVTASSLIVAACSWDNNATTCSVSDDNSGAWTPLGSVHTGTGALAAYRLQLFCAPGHAAGVTNFTASLGAAGNVAMALHEFSGVATSSPVDAGPTYENVSSASPTNTALTTVTADTVIFVTDIIETNYVSGPAAPFTLDEFAQFGGNPTGHRIVSSTGSYSSTVTLSAPAQNMLAIVAFKIAGGGGGGGGGAASGRMTILGVG